MFKLSESYVDHDLPHFFHWWVGAAPFGLKFNFYNNAGKGESVSFYPQIEFPAPAPLPPRKTWKMLVKH